LRTQQLLNPWFPKQVIPTVGVFVTAAEITLGLALLTGIYTRWAARLSGLLILAFAIGMTAGTGIKSVLNASVLAASACGWLLARAERYPLSVDSLRESPARFT
jgi:thiosulfate dehydrogenase (quinone) large subunit